MLKRYKNWKLSERSEVEDVLDKMKYDDHPIWNDKEKIREALAFSISTLNRALPILAELVEDVDAAGIENTQEDWPDMLHTYTKACNFLGDEKTNLQ